MTDPRETSVLAAAAGLVDAFARHDKQAYFAAFAPQATFIFHTSPAHFGSRDAYQAEWELWETRDGFRVQSCSSSDRHVQFAGDLAIFTHRVETEVMTMGESLSSVERETIVFQHFDGQGWLAVHEHLSPAA